MATLEMTLDTETEELTVKLNGKKLENVMGVSVSRYKDYDSKINYSMYVDLHDDSSEDVMHTSTNIRVVKAESKLGKQIAAEGRILRKERDLIFFRN